MNLYRIDYKRLVLLLLPTSLRRKKIVMLLTASVQPLVSLHAVFMRRRSHDLYNLAHKGQVCYLRKVLNDAFPDRNKSFRIEDVSRRGKWLYAKSQRLSGQLYVPRSPRYLQLWSVGGIVGETASFMVVIPDNLQGVDTLYQIKAKVNEYKLLSKKAIYRYG